MTLKIKQDKNGSIAFAGDGVSIHIRIFDMFMVMI